MKTCIWVLMCMLLIACLSSCSLLSIAVLLFSQYAFHADITVTDLSGTHYWDEAPAGTIEYSWGVMIDWDANATTGDPDGFDAIIWVTHGSSGAGTEGGQLDVLLNETQSLSPTFGGIYGVWSGGGWGFEGSMIVERYASGNTIGITFDRAGELADPAEGFRTRFFASYYPPPAGPAVSDETSIVTESASTTDAAGDAGSYPFIDIVSAKISYIPPKR